MRSGGIRQNALLADWARPGLAGRVGALLPRSSEGLVTALINELAADPGPDEVLLVLDDYHLVDSGPVHESVAFLLENLPPGPRVVMSGRADPPLPLDEVRGWWRYHHLFADPLRARLQAEQPGRVQALHRAAAAWCEEHDLADDAVRHALAAGDLAWAARLVERHVETLLGRSEGAFLRAVLARLRGDAAAAAGYNQLALAELGEDDWLMRSFVRWNLAAADWLGGQLGPAERGLAEVLAERRTAAEAVRRAGNEPLQPRNPAVTGRLHHQA